MHADEVLLKLILHIPCHALHSALIVLLVSLEDILQISHSGAHELLVNKKR